ncbi:HMG box-containing protein 4-like [Lampris incognitus]|uniref:HMG box-containing protein 4-like n=1 Tax=Lampris incognitus TaxID=2546036 RepID=UPI0024B4ECBA|nr:HMG box-containing protein 4-like [Lampris incognitus]
MDGERQLVSGVSQRREKRSYADFLLDAEEPGGHAEEMNAMRPRNEAVGPVAEVSGGFDKLTDLLTAEEPESLPKRKWEHFGHCRDAPELNEVDSFPFFPSYDIYAPQDGWKERGEEAGTEVNWLDSISTAEGGIDQPTLRPLTEHWEYLDNEHTAAESFVASSHTSADSPLSRTSSVTFTCSSDTAIGSPIIMASPTAFATSATSSTSESLRFNHVESDCLNLDPMNAAAHLHLLGESLSLIGHQLLQTNKMVCMSSCLSLLLDSLLCGLAPLACLTSHIPELRSCLQHTMADTLGNIAYVMPGL